MTEPARGFLDSNILLYLLHADARRANAAEFLLQSKPHISVQVLNEVTNVCARKLNMPWADIDELVALIKVFCRVVPLTVDVHDKARDVAKRYQLSFYDACIAASALSAKCQILYTEDMHASLCIDQQLTLVNPFVSSHTCLNEPGL